MTDTKRAFPPKQIQINVDRTRWVFIGYLEKETQKKFWQQTKEKRPLLYAARRNMGPYIKAFSAVMKVSETDYNEIMGETV